MNISTKHFDFKDQLRTWDPVDIFLSLELETPSSEFNFLILRGEHGISESKSIFAINFSISNQLLWYWIQIKAWNKWRRYQVTARRLVLILNGKSFKLANRGKLKHCLTRMASTIISIYRICTKYRSEVDIFHELIYKICAFNVFHWILNKI